MAHHARTELPAVQPGRQAYVSALPIAPGRCSILAAFGGELGESLRRKGARTPAADQEHYVLFG